MKRQYKYNNFLLPASDIPRLISPFIVNSTSFSILV